MRRKAFAQTGYPRQRRHVQAQQPAQPFVVDQQPNPSGFIAVRHVIDGQQRLTTLQLLLDAAQEVTEKHGTSLGQSLRVLAQESRDTRMSKAEKKAAALPPKLTVPMILFFLPVLFAIILTPAILQLVAVR